MSFESAVVQQRHASSNYYQIKPTMRHLAILGYPIASMPHCGLFVRWRIMVHLPTSATDQELIAFIDQWAALMEREDYEAAFAHTDHIAEMKWTASLIKDVIKAYDECEPDQKVTLYGIPTDATQRKNVDRWPKNDHCEIAEVWYDLNINGLASDLTATFRVVENSDGLVVKLNDIHVM